MVKSGLEEVEAGSGAGYGGYDIPRVRCAGAITRTSHHASFATGGAGCNAIPLRGAAPY